MGPDVDSANLYAMVAYAKEHWAIDESRVLLTGMSDGGTFSYVSGMRSDAPFTHLAPSSASFHPMLVEAADRNRLQGLHFSRDAIENSGGGVDAVTAELAWQHAQVRAGR